MDYINNKDIPSDNIRVQSRDDINDMFSVIVYFRVYLMYSITVIFTSLIHY